MIFVTDLDRTLIYSHLFLENADCSYRLIEKKGEKPIAYMSEEGIRLLQALHERVKIIPVTLRNEMEFYRIDLFRELVQPEIFVVNNGGSIYYHGQEDEKWHSWIQQNMSRLTFSKEQIRQLFFYCYRGRIEKTVDCGGLIWMFMGEKEALDQAGAEAFKELVYPSGWRIDRSGRKIYVYPWFVTKWQAVSYIQREYYEESILAAGDSIFDLEMVEKADHGIIPSGAYIEDKIGPHIKLTAHQGMRAAEDILAYAMELIKRENA